MVTLADYVAPLATGGIIGPNYCSLPYLPSRVFSEKNTYTALSWNVTVLSFLLGIVVGGAHKHLVPCIWSVSSNIQVRFGRGDFYIVMVMIDRLHQIDVRLSTCRLHRDTGELKT